MSVLIFDPQVEGGNPCDILVLKARAARRAASQFQRLVMCLPSTADEQKASAYGYVIQCWSNGMHCRSF